MDIYVYTYIYIHIYYTCTIYEVSFIRKLSVKKRHLAHAHESKGKTLKESRHAKTVRDECRKVTHDRSGRERKRVAERDRVSQRV